MLATIGYEGATQEELIYTLQKAGVEVLVDIRERAQSRKLGFSKSALSQAIINAGMEYIHFRSLGDPKNGRDAARAGDYEKFISIFESVLAGEEAQSALVEVIGLARKKHICLMCYERDHRYCHRNIVSDRVEEALGEKTFHLGVVKHESGKRTKRQVFHTSEGAAAQV